MYILIFYVSCYLIIYHAAVAVLYSLTYRQKQMELLGEDEMPLYSDLESLVVR